MSVGEMILSDQTYDFIVAQSDVMLSGRTPDCVLPLGNGYELWYVKAEEGSAPSIQSDGYAAIPKCYGLLDNGALTESGILRLQNQPTLELKGEGVLVGIIDTGIRYELSAFRNADGTTRIAAIWDQSGRPGDRGGSNIDGDLRACVLYGVEYDRDAINRALQAEDPFAVIPNMDEDGHGTYLASIACGSANAAGKFANAADGFANVAGEFANDAAGFVGAAPLAELLVVKLKPAKKYLKDYYFIPEQKPVFQENDIMAAIAYLQKKAAQLGKPLALFLGLGTNNGSHGGSDPLSEFVDRAAIRQGCAIAVAAGNEANMRHHFLGEVSSVDSVVRVELNVTKALPGFYVELWATAPEFFSAEVLSPTGERSFRTFPRSGMHQEYRFLFEETMLTMEYRSVGASRRDQLIFFRFTNVPAGIWTIMVYPENIVSGRVNLWLPMAGMLAADVFFMQPNPDITLTAPSAAAAAITVGGYNSANGAYYLDSGRGNTILNMPKPDFAAPSVEVAGIGLRGQLITNSGTSAGAAVTAGACAQILEWAVVREKGVQVNSVEIKNLLIRGCRRTPDQAYPNRSTGYGRMNVFQSFEAMRNTD